jgi:hypothetical protein
MVITYFIEDSRRKEEKKRRRNKNHKNNKKLIKINKKLRTYCRLIPIL